jgi:hypothetical protein
MYQIPPVVTRRRINPMMGDKDFPVEESFIVTLTYLYANRRETPCSDGEYP